MHKSSDGEVVGVAVFLKTGRASPTLQRVLDHGPATEGQLAVPGLMIDPSAICQVSDPGGCLGDRFDHRTPPRLQHEVPRDQAWQVNRRSLDWASRDHLLRPPS